VDFISAMRPVLSWVCIGELSISTPGRFDIWEIIS
jgi:hypothetical protein